MRRRRGAVIRLIAVLVVVLAAATYFLKINPLYDAIHKGLDLQGGVEVVYQASAAPGQPLTPQALQQTVQVLELRVNKLGVSEPVIQSEPPNRILVQLAGVANMNQALQTLGTTANLQFKDESGNIIVTGKDLQSAQPQILPGQQYVVALNFDAAGRKAFANFTSANQNKQMSIYIDGKLIESPTIQPGCCPTGQTELQGNFPTFQSAQDMAIELNSGALPLNLSIVSEYGVSATLGKDSVRASMLGSVVALALIIAFMLLTYRIPGFWADIALLVYSLVLLAVLVGINATLTLPGITGLILSIGMAVDSNVIIFERIREELREGRSIGTAVEDGYRHGMSAIWDTHATTIISSVVLYYLGTGLIRGFAVTLGIGVVVSLLTAVLFTQYLLRWQVGAGIRPSWWFFAPRAAVAAAGSAPAAPPGAPRAPSAGGRVLLGNLRRDWRPEPTVPAAQPRPAPESDAVAGAGEAPAPQAGAPAAGPVGTPPREPEASAAAAPRGTPGAARRPRGPARLAGNKRGRHGRKGGR